MIKLILDRAYLVLASVYLYNEHQGFSKLELLLKAFRKKFPSDQALIEAIAKHAADEKKHYLMFQNYFKHIGHMPLAVGARFGYVDQFIWWVFRTRTERLDTDGILNDEGDFFRLCRVIMMTEFRGLKQVRSLLRSRWIQREPELMRIFRIIERDEPSHCLPYQAWLTRHDQSMPKWREKLTDRWIHVCLMVFKIPYLYLDITRPRLRAFPHSADDALSCRQ